MERRISDRMDSGKTVCSIFYRHFHDEQDNAAYIRTVELLCCQPDIRTCDQRLDFRCAWHLCYMLSADALCFIHLSMDIKARRENRTYIKRLKYSGKSGPKRINEYSVIRICKKAPGQRLYAVGPEPLLLSGKEKQTMIILKTFSAETTRS